MRATFANIGLLPAAALLLACSGGDDGQGVMPSGTGTTRSYDVTGFTEVAAAGSDDVEVRVGPAYAVRAEGPADVLDRLRIERRGDALSVGRRRGGWSRETGTAKVFVTMPRIAAATLAGSGDLSVDGAAGDAFAGRLAGSGALRLTGMTVGAAAIDLAGSGDVTAGGRAERLSLRVAGSGNVDARQLAAAGADVSVAGSGDVRATVSGDAEVRLTGSGDADLGDRARCRVRKAGSGEVRCGSVVR